MRRFIIFIELGKFSPFFSKWFLCSFLTSLNLGLSLCIGTPHISKVLFIFLYFFSAFQNGSFTFTDSFFCSNNFCLCFFCSLLLSPFRELFISVILLFKLRIHIGSFLKKIIFLIIDISVWYDIVSILFFCSLYMMFLNSLCIFK